MAKADAPETLYPDESELARTILGERAREWPAKAVILEREGLPKIDPLMGARFWPAVKKWFFSRHGFDVESSPNVPAQSRVRVIPFAVDGEADFDGEKAEARRYPRRDRRHPRPRITAR